MTNSPPRPPKWFDDLIRDLVGAKPASPDTKGSRKRKKRKRHT